MAGLPSRALSGLQARLRTPGDRRLALRVSSLLWLIGSLGASLMLVMPGGEVSGPGVVLAISAFGLAWAAVTLRAPTTASWSVALPHLSMVLAMAAVAGVCASSGGDDSPAAAYLWFVVVYAAFFFSPAEALAYWVACTGVQALPLLYAHEAMHEDNGLRDLVVAGPSYVVVGALVMAGRARLSGASARAVEAEEVQHQLADEQASLRRVATAVAAGSPPQAIMALVASEAGRLLGADGAAIVAFESSDRVSVRGFWTGAGEPVIPQAADADVELQPGDEMLELRERASVVRHDDYPSGHPSRAFAMGFRSFLAAPVHTENALWGGVVVVCRRPGAFSSCAENRLRDFAGLISTAVANAEDRARLDVHAAVDALTGLHDSRAFAERLDQEVSRARRHDRPLALAIADVDGFKAVNDRAGTECGDLVLKEIAGALRACVRDEDIIARLAGDDFAILFVESDREEAFAAVERSRAHVASARIVAGVLDAGQASWIGRHHERPDGQGYPLGLRGDELDDGAALLAVAEAWDSMTRESWYRRAKSVEDSLAECRALAGRQFGRAAVGALETLGRRGDLTLAATRLHRPTDLAIASEA